MRITDGRWNRSLAALAVATGLLGGGVLAADAGALIPLSVGARATVDEECVAADGGGSDAHVCTLDDGEELLPRADISIEEAVDAAQATDPDGAVGEIGLEAFEGRLVFNVDVGETDVKVDAATGDILSVDADD